MGVSTKLLVFMCLISSFAIGMEYKGGELEEKKQELSELIAQLEEIKRQLLELTQIKEDFEKRISDLKVEIKVQTLGVTDEGTNFVKMISKICTSSFSGKHLKLLDENMSLINAKDLEGRTPLGEAVGCSKWNLVKALIERGAQISDSIFITAIEKYDQAVNKGLVKKIIEYMLVKGANPNAKDGKYTVWNAFLRKHNRTDSKSICDLAELLVKYGSDINLSSRTAQESGEFILVTPLEYARMLRLSPNVIKCLERLDRQSRFSVA